MTNTATLNTSNKNTNNRGKLRYILRKIKQVLLSKTSRHTNSAKKIDANLNIQERERGGQTDRQTDRERFSGE